MSLENVPPRWGHVGAGKVTDGLDVVLAAATQKLEVEEKQIGSSRLFLLYSPHVPMHANNRRMFEVIDFDKGVGAT